MVSKTIVAGSIPAAPAIQKNQKNTTWCSFFCLKLHYINAKTDETMLFINLRTFNLIHRGIELLGVYVKKIY